MYEQEAFALNWSRCLRFSLLAVHLTVSVEGLRFSNIKVTNILLSCSTLVSFWAVSDMTAVVLHGFGQVYFRQCCLIAFIVMTIGSAVTFDVRCSLPSVN